MSQPSGAVFDVKRFAIHDGPGIRTTVFFKGCPLSCLWCHNPESQRAQPELLYWAKRCTGCGACVAACPVDAVSLEGGWAVTNRSLCTGCGACIEVCPSQAREIAGEVWSLGRLLDAVERDVLFYDESNGEEFGHLRSPGLRLRADGRGGADDCPNERDPCVHRRARDAVRDVLAKYGTDELEEGDILITNDPYMGGATHQNDVVLVLPIFHENRLVMFAAGKAHWNDVGGKDPGSWTPARSTATS